MQEVTGEMWTGLRWRGHRRPNEETSTKNFFNRLEKAHITVLRHDGGFCQCKGEFGDRTNTATTIEYFDWIALQDLRKGLKPLTEIMAKMEQSHGTTHSAPARSSAASGNRRS